MGAFRRGHLHPWWWQMDIGAYLWATSQGFRVREGVRLLLSAEIEKFRLRGLARSSGGGAEIPSFFHMVYIWHGGGRRELRGLFEGAVLACVISSEKQQFKEPKIFSLAADHLPRTESGRTSLGPGRDATVSRGSFIPPRGNGHRRQWLR